MQIAPQPIRLLRRSLAALLTLLLSAPLLYSQSLLGSRTSMLLQSSVAQSSGFSYLRTPSEVEEFVDRGILVRVRPTATLQLGPGLSFPYARPEVKLFLERLSRQYEQACGEPLVATSLTRPINLQPRNASELSVHPTGMAVDLRRSWRASCRRWLESALLNLEDQGVLEATREHTPAHYHVSIFPIPYKTFVASNRDERDGVGAYRAAPVPPRAAVVGRAAQKTKSARVASRSGKSKSSLRTVRKVKSVAKSSKTGKSTVSARSKSKRSSISVAKRYRVSSGDTLWNIAKRHRVSVATLRKANRLGSQLRPGQMIKIPVAR
jgi:LysM repeat protein